MKMYRVVCTAVVFAFAILVSSLGLSSSVRGQDANWEKVLADGKKEGTLTAVSTVMKGKSAVAVMKAFKDEYGISLDFFPGRVGAAIEKIITEQKSKSYVTDSLDTHGTEAIALQKAGYLQSVAASLPALNEKDKFLIPMVDDPDGQLINIAGESTYICVNTDLVKPEDEPKSYQDLLDPKWKGKIILLNPVYNSSPDQMMLALTQAKIVDEDYFKKLYQDATVGGPGGADEAMDKLVRGEFAIGAFFSSGIALKPIRDGAPIKVLDLKEGYVFKTARIAALTNMPHPNATRVYFNWLLTKEGQTVMAKETDLEPLRNDVPSTLPFRMEGPRLTLTYQDQLKLEERASRKYMANLLGLKK